ncbi:MAG: diaminopimelate decarboxylase [Trueperaceae bacterium]|nr:diaminopimelate decarboxylase [Trueperaceae bacterium]
MQPSSTIDDATLHELAEAFGTPLWIYDLREIDAALTLVRDAFPHAHLAYAAKANANRAILRHLHAHGVGAEVITVGELARVLRAEMNPAGIVVGGPAQDRALRELARRSGVGRISLDSVSQWADWRDDGGWPDGARAFVRVNPALDPATHEHMATGQATSKFGLAPDEALALAREVADAGVLAGLHVHAGSQITDTAVHDGVLAVLAPLYDALPEAYELDLGGGFAVPGYPYAALAERVTSFTEARGLRLWLEPGRALVATAGTLLTRVLHVKEGVRRHVIADAGMADLLRPALYGAHHPVRAVSDGSTRRSHDGPTDVDGPLCENADRIARDAALPDVLRGDLLAVELAGAYGLAMGSHYASHTRAAEVVIDGGGAPRLARRREVLEALWADEVDEEGEGGFEFLTFGEAAPTAG